MYSLPVAGSPAVVPLGGEAGAGKTRMIAEFAHVAAGQALLLSGACVDLGGAGLAFAPKTASVHVSDILAKLGVHSRVDAAAIAYQAGITSTAGEPGRA